MARRKKGASREDRRRARGKRASPRRAGEWVGGTLAPPVTVDGSDGDAPFVPELRTWIEVSSGFVVGQSLNEPGDPDGDLGALLQRAITEPAIGLPRRPARVRVSNERDASEVAEALPDMPVNVAATPELEEMLAEMARFLAQAPGAPGESAPGEGMGYLALAGTTPALVGALFAAAAALWRAEPWRDAVDSDVLRIDVPSMDIDGACLAIIGALREDFGFVLFPSIDGYDRFTEMAGQAARSPGPGPVDMGSACLSLTFERGGDLPKRLRREVARHGFEVAASNAYPVAMNVTRERASVPPRLEDLTLLTACTRALVEFHARHLDYFGDPAAPAVSLDVTTPEGVAVKISGAGAGGRFDLAAHASERPPQAQAYDRLAQALTGYAFERFGENWSLEYIDGDDLLDPPEFGLPIAIFHIDGQHGDTLAEAFARSPGANALDSDTRAVLAAEQRAWLSVWEVTDVTPGKGFDATDTLSGLSTWIFDISASQHVRPGAHILARVLLFDDASLLSGTHPHFLSPGIAQVAIDRARKRLRRKRKVPPERMRDPRFCYALAAYWEDAAAASLQIPALANTDGDPLLQTTDHYDIKDPDIEAGLRSLDGATPPASRDEDVWHFDGPAPSTASHLDNVLLGRAFVHDDRLVLETNSVARADALRARVEAALGNRIVHRARKHQDPMSALPSAQNLDPDLPTDLPPELQAQLVAIKQKFYADWAEQPIPALDGKTPLEAMRSRAGAKRVETLLNDMEYAEASLPPEVRMDFQGLRRELGLPPK